MARHNRAVRAAIEIDASASTIFPYLTDADLIRKWAPGLVDIEAKPPAVGETTTYEFRLDAQRIPGRSRIIALQAPNLIVSEETQRGVFMIQRTEIIDLGGGRSRVTLSFDELRVPFWMRLLEFGTTRSSMRRRADLAMKRLKAVVERPEEALPVVRFDRPSALTYVVGIIIGVVAALIWQLVSSPCC